MSAGHRFGSYELVERIGRGGMAEVWRARARGAAGFEKEVVLKRVLPSLLAGTDFAELLIREAKIAARLHHPNVVQIFDLGEQDGSYYIAMEYVAGCDLATAIACHSSPRLAEGEVGLGFAHRLFIVAEAARALDYAHRRLDEEGRPLHIVHRDISPQNILLGFEGEVKVADFGIARADAAGLGAEEDPGVLRGKYAYMSPEQARSETLDGRSDLFALGVVLWELSTGQRLFKGASSDETLRKVRAGELPDIPPGLPPGLDEVLALALAPRREQRFATAGELGQAVLGVLHRSFAAVDNAELAQLLVELLPSAAEQRVNKLHVDLGRRMDGEAAETLTALTAGGADETHAFPVSRRISVLERPIISVVARALSQADLLEQLAVAAGAVAGAAPGAEVVWSFAGAGVDAHLAAAKVAHEWREQHGMGAAVLLEGDARVWQGGRAAELKDTALERARRALDGLGDDQTRCAPELVHRLEGRFRLDGQEWARLKGYRLRAEQDLAAHLRLPMIGRHAQFKALVAALERSEDAGHSVWLIGDGGSGKSRLLAELNARAPSAQLLTGRGGDSRSFSLIADVFADLVGVDTADASDVVALKLDRLRVLGLGEMALARVRELFAPEGAPVRERLGRPRGLDLAAALGQAVESLSHDKPVVVVFEDLHHADESSLQLLPLLRSTLKKSHVLTVFTTRPPAPVAPVATPAIMLDALDPGALGRLFARAAGGRAIEAELSELLASELGGNPGAIVDVAALLVDGERLVQEAGVFRYVGDGELPIPARWRADQTRGLADLPSEDRSVLAAMAVLHDSCDVATLAAVCGQTLPKVELSVRRLLELRLLESVRGQRHRLPGAWGGEGGDVRVPAELRLRGGAMVRRSLLGALGEHRVRALHGRIVEVLAASGAEGDERVERMAFHAARAEERRQAPELLARAAKSARERGELLLAAERYAEAARVGVEVEVGDAVVCEFLVQSAEVALEAGAVDQAASALAAVPHRADETEYGPRLAVARATLAKSRGDPAGAAAHLMATLSADDGLEPDVRAELALRCGLCQLRAGTPEAAARTFREALAALEELNSREVFGFAARAQAWLSVCCGRVGDEPGAELSLAAALRLSLRAGDASSRLAALIAAAERTEAQERLDDAATLWSDAYGVVEEACLAEYAPEVALRAAVVNTLAEDEGAAAVFAERAAQLGRTRQHPGASALAAAVRGVLAARAHPQPDFVPAVVRGIDDLEAAGRIREAAMALEMLAAAHVALGDPPAAIRTLGRALPLAERAVHAPLARRLARAAERLAEGRAPYEVTPTAY